MSLIQDIRQFAKSSLMQAKQKYDDFNIYDFASQQLNLRTAKTGFSLSEDIDYGEHPRQCFDLYYSDQPRADQAIIVFVHGGTWARGDKSDYLFLAESFTQSGFHVAVINYRLAPVHQFPDFVDDLVLALNHLSMHQQKLDISMQHVILMGHSAGGFNVMSALYSPTDYELLCRANIRAVVGLAGPYHFKYVGDASLEKAFNKAIDYQTVMPYYFVQHNQIEHILLLAQNDVMVAAQNTKDMHQALLDQGNSSRIVTIPRTGHVTLVGSVSSHFARYFKTKKVILTHIEASLRHFQLEDQTKT